ncbi:MAG: insulinase family protein [Gammaproteobacteria bacterium]|nr:insulinase family protein [Gammaproteobacteria bacterium]
MLMRICLILGFVFSLLSPSYAGESPHEFLLDNGLKLIVKKDVRAPVVVSQVWYKVGSSYEYNGITGVSHVLEHMMFKGTDQYAPGEFSRIIAANGGRENAFTGRDYTAYFQQLEKSRLEISFKMESDRMRGLLLPEEEFAKEVKVVMEERRMRTEDNPQALTREQFYATAFTSNPYRNPIVGWMGDLKSMAVSDLRVWYQRWYAPNNAVVVVVGDVDPQAVLALAKKYFEPLKPSEIISSKPRVDAPQLGEKRITVKAPAKLPYLMMGYHTPVLKFADKSWEPYALEVLAGVLDGGSSARLTKELVRGKEVAAAAGVGYSMIGLHNDLFSLSGTPTEAHNIETLETEFLAQIEALKNTLVDESELARVKAQVVASNVYELDSVFYQAMQIGMLETIGLGWPMLDEYVDKVRAVTAEQVRSVARKYLLKDQLTVAVLEPTSTELNIEPSHHTGGLVH